MGGELDLTNIKNAFEELYSINKYKEQINRLLSVYPKKRSLEIDYRDVERYDPALADLLINEPDSVIKAAEEQIREMEFAIPTSIKFAPHVRFFNLPQSDILIEQIDSSMINKLITFKGVITRRAEVMHKVSVAVYKCQACEEILRWHVTREFSPPGKCPVCRKGTLAQLIDESKFVDLQRAEIQDLLERVRGGTPAAKLHIVMEDDLVNSIVPGNNVEITGILRLMPQIKTSGKKELIFSRYLETVHIKRMKRDFEEVEITKEDEKRILELASMPDIEEKIVNSIAPDIYGYTEIKKGIALQLFGGTRDKVAKGGTVMRDDIHILLVGDPGLAKTRFLQTVDTLAPKSIYVSGKSVSGVGLCVSGDSIISINDGGMLEIKEYVESNFKEGMEEMDGAFSSVHSSHVLSANENLRIEYKNINKIWKIKPPKSMVHLITERGKELKLTPQTKVICMCDGIPAWKKAADLKKGELIATSRKVQPLKGAKVPLLDLIGSKKDQTPIRKIKRYKIPKYLSPDICYLAGLFAGSGNVYRNNNTAYIKTTLDEESSAEINRIVKQNFGILPIIKRKGNGTLEARLSSPLICEIFNKLGLPFTVGQERLDIPPVLISGGEECAKAYLQGLFDSKSTVNKKTITLSTASKRLATKVLLLLEWWGVVAKLRNGGLNKKVKIEGKNAIARKPQYIIEICGVENLLAFKNSIGFRKRSKKETLEKLVGTSMQKKQRKKTKEVLTDSDVYWDKIVFLEEVKPEEEWVYDVTVQGVHNFLANGIIVHNTASAEKDELGEGGWTLKAGALVLASGGIACIDEFDKISKDERGALHEVMESQSVSIAKAGIVARFKAKTAIIAAANPTFGRFNQKKNISEQFDVPPSLLSRFDLIFPIIDVLNTEKDEKLASYMLQQHMEATDSTVERPGPPIDKELLRKYIAYARRNVRPRLTREAVDLIKEFYIELRRIGQQQGSVAITPRYLEGLVRLSEANAKMRLSNEVERRDAEAAISLMRYMMEQSMMDKETGKLDVDIISTGRSQIEREKATTVFDIIKELNAKFDEVEVQLIYEEAEKYGIDSNKVEKTLEELDRKGVIYYPRHGYVRLAERG